MDIIFIIYLIIILIGLLILFLYKRYTNTKEYHRKKIILQKYNETSKRISEKKNYLAKITSELNGLDSKIINEKRYYLYSQWDPYLLKQHYAIGKGTCDILLNRGYDTLDKMGFEFRDYPNNFYFMPWRFSNISHVEGIGNGRTDAIRDAIQTYLENVDYYLENNVNFKGKNEIERKYAQIKNNLKKDLNDEVYGISKIEKEIKFYEDRLSKYQRINFFSYISNYNGYYIED